MIAATAPWISSSKLSSYRPIAASTSLLLPLEAPPPQEHGYIGARLAEKVLRTCHLLSTDGREAL